MLFARSASVLGAHFIESGKKSKTIASITPSSGSVTGSVTLAGTIQLSSLDGYVPAPNASFQIFNFGSLINAGLTLDTTGLDLPAGETLNASTFASTGEFSVTPEPTSGGLLLAGSIGLLTRRRRKAIFGQEKCVATNSTNTKQVGGSW